MPCRDDYPIEQVPSVPDYMLCEAMTLIEQHGLLKECNPSLRSWWSAHKSSEQSKVRREAAQRLDARQRLALNIDADGNPLKVAR